MNDVVWSLKFALQLQEFAGVQTGHMAVMSGFSTNMGLGGGGATTTDDDDNTWSENSEKPTTNSDGFKAEPVFSELSNPTGRSCISSSSKGDCTLHDIEDEDGEFFMDSVVHRRVLAGATGKKISYASLPKGPVCDAQKYGNCIVPINTYTRPCTVYNHCKRGG
ncbi:hypothetical protein RJ639_019541 [Escallonia herrerae]|uniref:Uncharacterized protein n=1 Tax=Escallonia herrerae TaxID=1293975 RepID=A0AA89AJZ6_9ASTE|nr:hypothetical protein RJ639_019541 [Escallonia herrerae]